MKTLEVRRHSLTKKGAAREQGSLLSSEGVRLARLLGDTLPRFDHVLTGPDRRHVETAIALGHAVDEMINWPSGYVPMVVGHHDQWRWDHPYERYSELLLQSQELRDVADEHLQHWRRAVDQVPAGGAALVISSGGSIEPVLVRAVQGGDMAGWGSALHHLDGATLTFEEGTCVDVRVHHGWVQERVSSRSSDPTES
ncbi:hypothetical protein ACQBAU_01800 [Propionibacteriaceae bacterium Y2011]